LNIPFHRIGRQLDRILARRRDEVVVYCGHGPSSVDRWR
jgi:glyoxylase-like metal-dependent hydrolase (beta-lactamase superfamily II)